MRKLFFFKSSSASGGGNSNPVLPPPTDEKVNQVSNKVENNSSRPKGFPSRHQKQLSGSQNSATNLEPPGLRRSLSFSSEAFYSGGLGERKLSFLSDPSRSPTSRNIQSQLYDYPVG